MVILIAAVIWDRVQTERLIREFRTRMTRIEKQQLHTTQARIGSFFADAPAPRVDARARTVRRDTSDIPARGARMTKLTHRSNANARSTDDNRLPNDA